MYLAQNREKRDQPAVGSLRSVGRYYIRAFPFVRDYSIHYRILREGAITDAVDFSILATIPSY